MTQTINPEIELSNAAQNIQDICQNLLRKAPLNPLQREDIEAIANAAQQFHDYANAQMKSILSREDITELQVIRHKLRNHLNIIVGFSRIIVKELPDNLLLHMVYIRRIHEMGETLIERVDEIR